MFKNFSQRGASFNVRRLLYLPQILPARQRILFLILLAVLITSGVGIIVRVYFKITVSVPDVGGMYAEGMLREPRTINPIYASANDTDRDIARLVYSSLITYTGDGAITFDLAASHVMDENGKTHTVTIKKDVLWHDGKPLTADDIIFTINLIQNPQFQSPLRANWQGVTVTKIDQYTVQFSLRTPYTPFIENLAVGILPKHLWENVPPDQSLLHELNLKPVGSGPYTFSRFQQNKDGSIAWYELKRNGNYYREGPYLKKITFLFFKTEGERNVALNKGTIDGFGPAADVVAQSIQAENLSVKDLLIPRTFGIFFNQKKTPLEVKNIRAAIAYALDNERLARAGVSGGATPHDSPFPPTIEIEADAETPIETLLYEYSPEKARTILADAGWTDTNDDGILEKELKSSDSKTATTTSLQFVLTTSNWPDLTRTAELIKEMLAEVGIGITIKPLPLTELETTVLRPREFELLLFGHVYGYEPDPFSFWHSSQSKDPGLNITLYTNKKVDALLEEARQVNDPITRHANFSETAKLILQDLPAAFLYSQRYLYVLPSHMQGFTMSHIALPADRFNEINQWYLETKRVLK